MNFVKRGKDEITEDDFIRYHSPDDFGASDLNGNGVIHTICISRI